MMMMMMIGEGEYTAGSLADRRDDAVCVIISIAIAIAIGIGIDVAIDVDR